MLKVKKKIKKRIKVKDGISLVAMKTDFVKKNNNFCIKIEQVGATGYNQAIRGKKNQSTYVYMFYAKDYQVRVI